MGRLLLTEQYFHDQHIIIHVLCLKPAWLTMHLQATHVILVICVDVFIMFI